MIKCRNCGHYFEANFCNQCGQKATVGRITLANFLNEISENFLQINRGFFYTLKELFVRPGHSLDEFLKGKRKRHFRPVAYLLTLSTLYYLSAQFTGQNTFIGDIVTGYQSGATGHNTDVEMPYIVDWFLSNYAYSVLLLLPVFSLASYLSFLRYGKTYLEHVVVNSYITGHQAIFYSFFLIVGSLFNSHLLEMLPLFVSVTYTFWVFWQLFSEGSRTMIILRSMMTYILYMIFSLVLLIGLMVMVEW